MRKREMFLVTQLAHAVNAAKWLRFRETLGEEFFEKNKGERET